MIIFKGENNMYDDNNNKINKYLNEIGDSLTIKKEDAEFVEKTYNQISKLLAKQKEFQDENISIDIYSQGSYRLGTIIKPIGKEEFDLDFVFLVKSSKLTPKKIYDILFETLRKEFQEKVEGKKRCVQLKVNSKFHIDIIPAIPLDENPNHSIIKIPDKQNLSNWQIIPSNPKGYVKWFLDSGANKRYDESFSDEVKIEPLPTISEHENLPVLKKLLRIVKRHRDVTYYNNPAKKPISIILTTLFGKYIENDLSGSGTIQQWDQILKRIKKEIDKASPNHIQVENPSYKKENFSDKWKKDTSLYQEFKNYIEQSIRDIQELKNAEDEEELEIIINRIFAIPNRNDLLIENAIRKANPLYSKNAIPKLSTMKPSQPYRA